MNRHFYIAGICAALCFVPVSIIGYVNRPVGEGVTPDKLNLLIHSPTNTIVLPEVTIKGNIRNIRPVVHQKNETQEHIPQCYWQDLLSDTGKVLICE